MNKARVVQPKRSKELVSVSPNVTWHHATVNRAVREAQNGHRGAIIWFTGLSGAGKSTLAHAVEHELHQKGCRTFVMDGDNVRQGLCGDLGFSRQDRKENIRRTGEVAKLFVEAGVIVLTAFISPYREDRERVRGMVEHGDFFEIFCDCPIEVCESRGYRFSKHRHLRQSGDQDSGGGRAHRPAEPEHTMNAARRQGNRWTRRTRQTCS